MDIICFCKNGHRWKEKRDVLAKHQGPVLYNYVPSCPECWERMVAFFYEWSETEDTQKIMELINSFTKEAKENQCVPEKIKSHNINYGSADDIFQQQGEYWSMFICADCGEQFVTHAGPMMGK